MKILAFGLVVGVAVCLVGVLVYTIVIITCDEEPKPVPIPESERVIEIEEEQDQGSMNFWNIFKLVLFSIAVFIAIVLSALFASRQSKLKRRADTLALIRFYESLVPKSPFVTEANEALFGGFEGVKDYLDKMEGGEAYRRYNLPPPILKPDEEASSRTEELDRLLDFWRANLKREQRTALYHLAALYKTDKRPVCMKIHTRFMAVPKRPLPIPTYEWTFDETDCEKVDIDAGFLDQIKRNDDPEKSSFYITLESLESLSRHIEGRSKEPLVVTEHSDSDLDPIAEDDFINWQL